MTIMDEFEYRTYDELIEDLLEELEFEYDYDDLSFDLDIDYTTQS